MKNSGNSDYECTVRCTKVLSSFIYSNFLETNFLQVSTRISSAQTLYT